MVHPTLPYSLGVHIHPPATVSLDTQGCNREEGPGGWLRTRGGNGERAGDKPGSL